MATAHPPTPAATGKTEIKIVSHSNLFYWWPVWAVGFIMALITVFENRRLATVPAKSKVIHKAEQIKVTYFKDGADRKGEPDTTNFQNSDVLVAPEGKTVEEPHLQITRHSKYGVVFATVLLLVITITNIPLRGLWSVIVIVVIVSLVIILALMGAWEQILAHLTFLDIRINMGGYIFISTILFGLWLAIMLFFDQRIYMVFTPGQLRVRLAIGEGEMAYDTAGMTLQKERSDLFRHWILGLGSGDLVVQTAGAQAHRFDLHNVLFVGRKLNEIEDMLRSRQVVAAARID
jgi:hypothetical protein